MEKSFITSGPGGSRWLSFALQCNIVLSSLGNFGKYSYFIVFFYFVFPQNRNVFCYPLN